MPKLICSPDNQTT